MFLEWESSIQISQNARCHAQINDQHGTLTLTQRALRWHMSSRDIRMLLAIFLASLKTWAIVHWKKCKHLFKTKQWQFDVYPYSQRNCICDNIPFEVCLRKHTSPNASQVLGLPLDMNTQKTGERLSENGQEVKWYSAKVKRETLNCASRHSFCHQCIMKHELSKMPSLYKANCKELLTSSHITM